MRGTIPPLPGAGTILLIIITIITIRIKVMLLIMRSKNLNIYTATMNRQWYPGHSVISWINIRTLITWLSSPKRLHELFCFDEFNQRRNPALR
jgi:hypothetical protein